MTLLVVGASGLTGHALCELAVADNYPVVGTYRTAPRDVAGVDWRPLDLRDPMAVTAMVQTVRPAVVVNAAYQRDDWATCADGAANVALASAEVGARLVHVSSDAVHAGRPTPYGDADVPTPINAYGAAKAAAETAVRVVDPSAAIVRTSLIIGGADSQQVRLCLDLVRGVRSGALFTDEVRCPIGVADLAAALWELAASEFEGLINVAGPQAVSRAELGQLVAQRYGFTAADVPTATIAGSGLARPTDVRLDCALAGRLLSVRPRPVAELFDAARSAVG